MMTWLLDFSLEVQVFFPKASEFFIYMYYEEKFLYFFSAKVLLDTNHIFQNPVTGSDALSP